jgi:4-amino-4-deoxy-L-arabinose transferase-like glycosyltransferase
VSAKRWTLWGLLALAFALRAGFLFVRNSPLEFPDSVVYHQIAGNVCAGKGLAQAPQVTAFHPPGYPLFLAGCYALFGPRPMAAGVAQAALGTLTCLVIFLLARRAFDDERTGLIAAAIAAVYPFFVFYSSLLLSENLFNLLLVAGVWLLLEAARDLRMRTAALAGIVLGLGTLTRASLVGFVPCAAPFWWLLTRQRGRGRPLFVYGVVMVAAFAALCPWAVRNYLRTGHFVFTALQGGQALYEANCPEATGGPTAHLIDWDKVTEGKPLSEYERDRFLWKKSLDYIREHPGRFFRLAAVKLGRFWSPIPNYERYRSPLYNAVSLLSFGPVLVLAVVGVIQSRRRWREVLLLLSPVLYYSALHTVFVGSIRYRAPLEALLIVVAAYAIGRMWPRRSGAVPT